MVPSVALTQTVRLGGMPWPKTGPIFHQEQLGLLYLKGQVINL